MALPKVVHPTKKIKIPSLNIEAEFEPFTTADEKAIVLLDKDSSLYEKSMMQLKILQKCCKDEIDFEKLSAIEITYLFLQLRKISVGGALELNATCPNCNNEISLSVDIDLITFDATNLAPLKFTIQTEDGPYIVVCSQFIVDDLKYIDDEHSSMDAAAMVLRSMMSPDGNDVIEFTHDEKIELFNQLNSTDAMKIVDYINKSPVLQKDLTIKCDECDHEFKGELKDFFI